MCDSARAVAGATRLQTYRRTRQSVTSAPVKSAVVCGAAPASAVAHNVRAHRMSQSDDFVLINISFGRETSLLQYFTTRKPNRQILPPSASVIVDRVLPALALIYYPELSPVYT